MPLFIVTIIGLDVVLLFILLMVFVYEGGW